ncbi:MAG: HD domain-containing protein [Bdellovibrionota bacterium]
MSVSFADVVFDWITFDNSDPAEKLVLDLIDTKWMQRLRDINQTANTRLVYMHSEHTRFGHSVGVAYLAFLVMKKLEAFRPEEVEKYRAAVACAALMHDIGHLAPGSHTAFKSWFPDKKDNHEALGKMIIENDPEIQGLLNSHSTELTEQISAILSESKDIPAWTWEIISGGGWNVDRGHWCIADSVLAGVSYGKYNIPAIIDSLRIADDTRLALRENRLDAMMHFVVSRQAMYSQLYHHRVLLSADALTASVIKRVRDLGSKLSFADEAMQKMLKTSNPDQLELETVYATNESWFKYHLSHWINDGDTILSDLASRLAYRKLFKTVRVSEDDEPDKLWKDSQEAVRQAGFDPEYYLGKAITSDIYQGDSKHSVNVLMENGQIKELSEADPVFKSLVKASQDSIRVWYVMPAEAKSLLGRTR